MLSTQTIDALPVIPQAQRDELIAQPKARHTEILTNQVFAKSVEVRQADTINPPIPTCRAIAWNAERGYHPEAAANLLGELNADVLLLTEMDHGMARSGQKHTVARLAKKLGCGYVYGIEYLEFGLGSPNETARCVGQSNNVGYHGNAILSRQQIKRPALVRLEMSGNWFDPGPEARLGSRMATLATIEIGGRDIVFASVHLEDRTDPAGRCQQMESLLRDIEDYAPDAPAVIAGDLNCHSFDLHKLSPDPRQIRRLIAEDTKRLLRPQAHEPLFATAAEYGYSWEGCNQPDVATERFAAKPLSLVGNKKMDWFLTRGLKPSQPQVIAATPAGIAWPLSDHELISVSLQANHKLKNR